MTRFRCKGAVSANVWLSARVDVTNSPFRKLENPAILGPRQPVWPCLIVVCAFQHPDNFGCITAGGRFCNAPDSQVPVICLAGQHVGFLARRRSVPCQCDNGRWSSRGSQTSEHSESWLQSCDQERAICKSRSR